MRSVSLSRVRTLGTGKVCRSGNPGGAATANSPLRAFTANQIERRGRCGATDTCAVPLASVVTMLSVRVRMLEYPVGSFATLNINIGAFGVAPVTFTPATEKEIASGAFAGAPAPATENIITSRMRECLGIYACSLLQ